MSFKYIILVISCALSLSLPAHAEENKEAKLQAYAKIW